MDKNFKLDDIVQMKKKHPCGGDRFRVIRAGADVKIKCEECGRVVMMTRLDFKKRMKKNLTEAADDKRQ